MGPVERGPVTEGSYSRLNAIRSLRRIAIELAERPMMEKASNPCGINTRNIDLLLQVGSEDIVALFAN